MSDWNEKVIAEFRANEGRVGGRFEGAPMVLLHHTGRTSGREYVDPAGLPARRHRRRTIYVFASAAGAPKDPQWYDNIVAAGQTTVEVGTETYQVTRRDAVRRGARPHLRRPGPACPASPNTRPRPRASARSRWWRCAASEPLSPALTTLVVDSGPRNRPPGWSRRVTGACGGAGRRRPPHRRAARRSTKATGPGPRSMPPRAFDGPEPVGKRRAEWAGHDVCGPERRDRAQNGVRTQSRHREHHREDDPAARKPRPQVVAGRSPGAVPIAKVARTAGQ